jgi:hypothetical protein
MSTKTFDRKQLMKDIHREQRLEARRKLETLRARLKDARIRRKEAVAAAVKRCREARAAVTAKIRSVKAVLKEIKHERVATKQVCSLGVHEARALRTEIHEAKRLLTEEEKFRRDMRRIQAGSQQRKREATTTSARVRESESDDEVLSNIPAELVPLWNRVKRQMRATERMSRTEAFMKYAEEHPEEYLSSIDDKTDALVRELEERERRASAEVGRAEAPFYRERGRR